MSQSIERISLIILTFALVCALFIPFDTGANWFLWGPVFDAGHYPFFFVVTLIGLRFSRFLPATLSPWIRLPYFPLAVFTIVVEIIQPLFDRSASIVDVQNGLLGIAAAAVVSHSLPRARSHFMRLLILGFVASLTLPLLWPTRGSVHAITWRRNNFPILATFENTPESLLWGPLEPKSTRFQKYSYLTFVTGTQLKGGHGLLVETKTGYWAGLGYSAGDFNWSPYNRLHLSIYNPTRSAFPVYIRIDDPSRETTTPEGRFNQSYELQRGPNELIIPVSDIAKGPTNRLLDTSAIRALMIFVDTDDENRAFIVDDVHLE